jgi:hypothetical protein
MIEPLAAACERFGDDREVRVGVLFANGKHFNAGLDPAEVGQLVGERGPEALAGSWRYEPFGCGRRPYRSRSSCPCMAWPSPCLSSWPSTLTSGGSRRRAVLPARSWTRLLAFGGASFRAPA